MRLYDSCRQDFGLLRTKLGVVVTFPVYHLIIITAETRNFIAVVTKSYAASLFRGDGPPPRLPADFSLSATLGLQSSVAAAPPSRGVLSLMGRNPADGWRSTDDKSANKQKHSPFFPILRIPEPRMQRLITGARVFTRAREPRYLSACDTTFTRVHSPQWGNHELI